MQETDNTETADTATVTASESPQDTPTRRRSASRPAGPPAAGLLFQAPEFTEPLPARDMTEDAPSEEPAGQKKAAGGSAPRATDVDTVADDDDDDDDDESAQRRRRRRGGRGRRKKPEAEGVAGQSGSPDDTGRAPQAAPAQQDDGATKTEPSGDADTAGDGEAADDGDGDDGATSSRRRRRRRRRGDSEGSADSADTADSDDGVAQVKGSTRIEAKKQRRREGREAGRRRPPVVSEAEFLARRESVERVMAVRQNGGLTQIGVLEDGVLVEHYVSRGAEEQPMIGNVYLGRVQNVLPAMEAAFVDIGRGRNAVLYAGEVDWAGLGHVDGQPKKIEDVLKSGQPVLVQVSKEPVGHKGARLTGQISLPGRYVVYVPGGSMSGISRKLPENERNRLKKILKQVVPEDAGVIVRTAAEGASEEELTHDVSRLRSQWEEITKKMSGNAPELLHGEPDLAIKVVRDLFNEDFAQLVVAGDDAWKQIESYVSYVASSLRDRLEPWSGDGDIFGDYRIDEQIAKALERKVWLPSGGSLVIDRTEAMTVVDVNTGKFTGSGGNLEETVTKNNLEAAEEVVRQLRLRDIGGIIVIDFIDMVLESNRELVLRRLVECLGRDRTKHQVAEVTSLGLVQMTRKRIGSGLFESFTETCESCNGRGVHVHAEPVAPNAKQAGSAVRNDRNDRNDRRGRRRRGGQQAEQPPEPTTRGFEASATPGHASPADLLPVGAGESGSSATGEESGGDADMVAGSETTPDVGGDAAVVKHDEPNDDAQQLVQAVDVPPAAEISEKSAVDEQTDVTAPQAEPSVAAPRVTAASGTAGEQKPARRTRRRAQRPAGSPDPNLVTDELVTEEKAGPAQDGAVSEESADDAGQFDPAGANSVL